MVLYAGGFDEINIHLLPRVRRVRIWLNERAEHSLRSRGMAIPVASKAAIVAAHCTREQVMGFRPTIYTSARDGFEYVSSNEYISREPRHAVATEVVTMAEVISRWNIALSFVDDLDGFMQQLRSEDIEFAEQT